MPDVPFVASSFLGPPDVHRRPKRSRMMRRNSPSPKGRPAYVQARSSARFDSPRWRIPARIEVLPVAPVRPPQLHAQPVRLPGHGRPMRVVGHQAPARYPHRGLHLICPQQPQVRLPIAVVAERLTGADSTLRTMTGDTRRNASASSRHARHLAHRPVPLSIPLLRGKPANVRLLPFFWLLRCIVLSPAKCWANVPAGLAGSRAKAPRPTCRASRWPKGHRFHRDHTLANPCPPGSLKCGTQ